MRASTQRERGRARFPLCGLLPCVHLTAIIGWRPPPGLAALGHPPPAYAGRGTRRPVCQMATALVPLSLQGEGPGEGDHGVPASIRNVRSVLPVAISHFGSPCPLPARGRVAEGGEGAGGEGGGGEVTLPAPGAATHRGG